MTMHKKFNALLAVLFATSLTAGVVPFQAYASNAPRITEKVSSKPGNLVTPQEEAIISSAATKILRHIAQARSDIHNKDLDAAKSELGQANTLMKIIKTAMPTTVVKDRIWIAKKHLEYEDTQEVMPDLIPIYSSLDELTDYMPVQAARQHLDKAKKNLEKGKKAPAVEELNATDAALVYTEEDLPFDATRSLVADAKAALEKKDGDTADNALKAAEDNVVFLSTGIDEPLVAAKASLWQATRNYADGAYDDAKKDVKAAISELQRASEAAGQTASHDISQLIDKAKVLEAKIDKGGHSTKSELQSLWQRTAALSERAIEYMTTGWSRFRASSQLKTELIDAKLYLSYARIDQFSAMDTRQATSDLAQAENLLDKAATDVKQNKEVPMLQTRISEIQRSVKTMADANAIQRQEKQFYKVNSELGDVIRLL
jgi:hypothetical protein